MKTHWSLALVVVWALAGLAWAEDVPSMSVRTVTASQGKAVEDERLEDVLPLLKETLRFSSFELDGEYELAMTEGSQIALTDGYVLSLKQVQGKTATVNVTRKKKRIIQTRLSLRKDKPVIVGGFDAPGGGKSIIILKLISPDDK